jgi:plasminogen activator inhibitor 1 RNA-binding protein
MPTNKDNMFAALASDSEEDMKVVEDKKHAAKVNKPKPATEVTAEAFGTRKVEEGEYDTYADRGRGARGRGRAVRGRGRGAPAFDGEGRGGYGVYRGRGDRGRGERGARGRGERGARGRGERGSRGRGDRGRGERGARGGYRGGDRNEHPREAYSHLATKDQVTGEHQEGHEEHHGNNEGGYGHHASYGKREYDRKSGTGYGREVKKHGAGRGGWGNPDAATKYEHMDAEVVVDILADGPETTEETKVVEPVEHVHQEEPKEEEEEEVNNLTYAEYKAAKAAEKSTLTKATARAPEELKVANMLKYEKTETHVKTIRNSTKKQDVQAPQGINTDIEIGFQPYGDEPEDDFERPSRGRGERGRGGPRGRGDRGRGGPRGRGERGGYRGDRGAPRGDRGAARGGGAPRGGHKHQNFNALEEEFPAL